MDDLIEQVEELHSYLVTLGVNDDAQTLQNAQLCASSLGTEIIDTKLVLESFPFDQLIGRNGIAGLVRSHTGKKELAGLLQDIFRIFKHILEHYSTFVDAKDVLHLQDLCDSAYFITSSAKIKLEALKLLEVLLSFFGKDETYEIERTADKYFKELARSSKLSSTVCSQLKLVLGKMVMVFSDRLRGTPLPERLKRNYIEYLNSSLSTKSASVDLAVIQGTLAGLEYVINGVGLNPVGEEQLVESLYECLKRVSRLPDKQSEVSRRGAMRQALSLFSRHSTLFSKLILKDVQDWHFELTKWRLSKNIEDQRAGWKAISAFFKSVSTGLAGAKAGENMPKSLIFLINQFNSVIKDSSSSAKETSLAIQGYGQFAKQLVTYLEEEEYRNLVLEIISSAERFHVESDEAVQEKWRTSFPSHIQAVSSLVSVLPSPSQSVLHSVESVCLQLVRQFPLLPHNFHQASTNSLVSVLRFNSQKDSSLLENLVYHALLETCSHPAIPEDQIVPAEVITYKKYLPLWRGLINQQDSEFRTKTFNVLMKSLLEMIEKLDLTVIDSEEVKEPSDDANNLEISLTLRDDSSNDPISKLNLSSLVYEGKRARVCKDYTILVNAVDLLLGVLDNLPKDVVTPWLLDTWSRVSSWSYQYPEASSFYKLISRLLVITEFESDSKDMARLSQLIQEFLRNHITRMSFFDQTELRISAYYVIAHIPLALISQLLDVLPKAVELALDLGSTVPALANPMLETLLKMMDRFSVSEMQPIYVAALPKLRVFLSWTNTASVTKEGKKVKTGPIRDKPKKSGQLLDVRNFEEENCNISLQILAKVPIQFKSLFLPTPEELGETLTVWDTTHHLKLEVPLPDVILTLKLDSMLPLVIDIINNSSDRRARVAAGECLHALLLFMIGRTSQQTEDMASRAPMTKLFNRVFPVILSLCSDTDSVLQGLFQPLFSQLIHWFTKDSKHSSSETQCLLYCLIDTMCSSKDMGQKQEAGMYLQEFIVWSLKQTRNTSTNNSNIKCLLNRLFFLLRHPDVNKRLGGCMVFTHIYRILREDKNLVSDYLLEILSSFLISLKISQNDPHFCATVSECEKNIGHIKKILVHYLSTFQQQSNTRRTPAEFSSGTIAGLLDWLLDFLVVEHPPARRTALLLFTEICQATGASQRKIKEQKFGSMEAMIQKVFSAATSAVNPTCEELSTRALNAYCSVFEFVLWVLGCKTCDFVEVEQVVDWIVTFIKRISSENQENQSNMSSMRKFSKSENERRTAILRLWTLVTCIIELGHGDKIIEKTHRLHDLILPIMMEPSKSGFNFKQEKEKQESHLQLVTLLKSIKTKLSGYFSKLELYFGKVYLESQLFSLQHLLHRCIHGGVDKPALECYHFLFTNFIFTKDVDGCTLINELLNELPKSVTELKNLPLETVQNLTKFVEMICKIPGSLNPHTIGQIALSQEPKHVWFVNTFCQFLMPVLIQQLHEIIQKFVEDGKLTRVYDFFYMLANGSKTVISSNEQTLFYDCLLKHWNLLTAQDTSRSNTLKIIHLIRAAFERRDDIKHSIVEIVFKWFCNTLKNPKLNLKIKYKALSLLCLMLKLKNDAGTEILEALKMMSSLHFPVFSQELKEGSSDHDLYILVFKQILKSLEASQDKDILFFVISLICRDPEHICEEMTSGSLSKMIALSDVEKQLDLIKVPYDIFCDKTGIFSHSVKLAAMSKFLIPSLQSSTAMTVRRFYSQNLEALLLQISVQLEGNEEKKLAIITDLIGNLKLFSVLYSKLETSMVHLPGGIISQKAATILREKGLHSGKGDGKEMTGYLVKFLLESRKWNVEGASQMKKMLIEFHRERLICSISIISCTNLNEKVYNHYIFKEVKDKDQLIWSRILDNEKVIQLELLLEKQFTHRKNYVVIKQAYSDLHSSVSPMSHYLSDSSLSQEIGKYDYTGTMSQGVDMSERMTKDSTVNSSYLDVEEDEFGKNACFVQLIALMHYMREANIYTVPEENFQEVELPLWMQSVVAPLTDRNCGRNVKLFILTLIFKCSDVFYPFAVKMYKPVMDCLTDGTVCADGKLNYLALDLITMLLYWSEKTGTKPSSNDSLCTRILSLMMKNIYHEERRIFRINMEIVNTILEKWMECLQIGSCFTILEQMLDPEGDDFMNLGGFKLLSVFLAKNFTDIKVLTNPEFVKNVLSGLSSRRKDIYEQTGVCLGLLLKVLKTSEAYEKNYIDVSKYLGDLSIQTTTDKKSRFILILHGIQKNFPDILTEFVSRFQYSLKTLSGDDLNLALDMLISYSDYLIQAPEKLKTELNLIGLKSFLQSYDPSVQISALKIVHKVHLFMEKENILEFHKSIIGFIESRYLQQRRQIFEIFRDSLSKHQDEDVLELSLCTLIKMLNDTDNDLRRDVFEFFNKFVVTAKDSYDRMLQIFHKLKLNPNVILTFLPASVLSLGEELPTSKQKLFHAPLDQCDFKDYSVDTSWRSQYTSSMIPLYADTVATQSQVRFSGTQSTQMIHATVQNLQFSQTQNASTNVSHDGVSSRQRGELRSGMKEMYQQEVKVGNLVAGKRFTREESSASQQMSVFSKIAERRKIQKLHVEEDKQKSQAKNVKLMRKYRVGDLPDIQILISDLLRPLISLSQFSPQISVRLSVETICGIVESNEELLTDNSLSGFIDSLNARFRDSGDNDIKNFLKAMLEICVNLDKGELLDMKEVSRLCIKYKLEKFGIILFEKGVFSNGNKYTKKHETKRMKLSEDCNIEMMITYMELLKKENEFDNIKGILTLKTDKMNIHPKTLEALNYESNMIWNMAAKTYKSLIEDRHLKESHFDEEVDLWQRGYYDSLSKLGKWDEINSTFNETRDIWDTSDSMIDNLLNSGMHLSVKNLSKNSYDFLSQSFENDEKRKHLEVRNPYETCVLLSMREKHADTQRICKQAILDHRKKKFIDEISAANVNDLHTIQGLVELDNYLMQHLSGKPNDFRVWKVNNPNNGGDLNQWDKILSGRYMFLQKSSDGKIDREEAANSLALNYADLANLAIKKSNPLYAERGLRQMKSIAGSLNHEMSAMRRSIISKVAIMNYGKRKDITPVDAFCNVLKTLSNTKTNSDNSDVKDIKVCLYQIAEQNPNLSPSTIQRHLKSDADVQTFKEVIGDISDDSSDLIERLRSNILEYFSQVPVQVDLAEEMMEGARFTNDIFKKVESVEFAVLSVEYHLKAMKLGSLKSRQMFPNCLNLVKNYSECQDQFIQTETCVPSWMFLPWCNQMMSCLCNETTHVVFKNLVKRLVVEYPHAMMNSVLLQISRSHELSDDTLNFVFSLKNISNDYFKQYDSMLHHMNYLCLPDVLVKDLISSVEQLQKEFPKDPCSKVKQEVQDFFQRYFRNSDVKGSIFNSLFKEHSNTIEQSTKSLKKSWKDDLMKIVGQLEPSTKANYSLKEFSPYLFDFLASNSGHSIEVPGQYDNFMHPDPSRHVYISSFASAVSAFKSLRKPVQLTIIGSNGKSYSFIVKAEDVRLDQRIENLFEMCNICTQQTISDQKNLAISTYTIVPLTEKLGLIKFVPDTSPVKDFLSAGKSTADIGTAEIKLQEGMRKLTKEKNINLAYNDVGKLSFEEVVTVYEQAVQCTESDHLKFAIMKLSTGIEEFCMLRTNFVSSYSAVSVMQWILGIGDRHLSNYLICKKSGQIIPIDFGYSFGTATSFLRVPELVPLRLSPQIVEALGYHLNGFFRESMIQVLNSLKGNSDLLMSTLDMIVQEPAIDWLRFVMSKGDERIEKMSNFAKERVDITQEKLNGGTPHQIMIKELKHGVPRKHMEKLIKIIKRDRPKENQVSSCEQVDLLIKQSTDPNLLGRMWIGWSPHS